MKAIIIWWVILFIGIFSILCYGLSDSCERKREKRQREWENKTSEEKNSKLLEYLVIVIASYLFYKVLTGGI